MFFLRGSCEYLPLPLRSCQGSQHHRNIFYFTRNYFFEQTPTLAGNKKCLNQVSHRFYIAGLFVLLSHTLQNTFVLWIKLLSNYQSYNSVPGRYTADL